MHTVNYDVVGNICVTVLAVIQSISITFICKDCRQNGCHGFLLQQPLRIGNECQALFLKRAS